MDAPEQSTVDTDVSFNRSQNKDKATLYWKIRRLGYIFWLPLGGALIFTFWYFIPLWMANYQQEKLADAFFAECTKTFEETSQVPKIPEEDLQKAEKERDLTISALAYWSPKVSGVIRDGNWFAKIEFKNPGKVVKEKKIGVAVNEGAFDTQAPVSD